jgi:hypothetical protein
MTERLNMEIAPFPQDSSNEAGIDKIGSSVKVTNLLPRKKIQFGTWKRHGDWCQLKSKRELVKEIDYPSTTHTKRKPGVNLPASIEQFRRRITVGIEDSYMMLTWIIIVRINFRGKKNGA